MKDVMVLNDLAAITGMIGVKYVKGDTCLPWEIKSLAEGKIKKFVQSESREDWIKYHTFLFTRIYPSTTRFDSSNFNPFPSWSIGV